LRNILNNREIRKYIGEMSYSRVNHFIQRLNETNIIEEDKEILIGMFRQVDEVYDKVYPGKSFFNYNFILGKLVEKIGKDDIYEVESPYKNLRKLRDNERRWKEILKMIDVL